MPEDSVRASGLSRLAVALATAVCSCVAVVGADARWLAALGRVISRAGSIPAGVPYAAAPSRGWANVPVLAELVFHWLEALGGDRGLVLAQVAAVAIALSVLALDMRRAGAPDTARAVVLLAAPFAAVPALVVARSQLFSVALFPLAMLLLRAESRAPSRRIWLLVPFVALWSNLHGVVLVGVAVAALYLVLDRARRQPWTSVTVLLASVAALFATPALGRTGHYYLGVLHNEAAVRADGLWAPLSLHKPLDVLFLIVALPLLALAWRARPKPWELAAVAALFAATVHASRNSVWLVLFVATPAAIGLGRGRLRTVRPSPRLVTACACVPVVLLVIGATRAPMQSTAGQSVREQAARLSGGAPILADDVDAERLALDGRRVLIANPIDAFPRVDQRLYLSWLEGLPEGDALLGRVRAVVVELRSPAQRRLARSRSFREITHDARSALYVRRAGATS